MKQGSVLAPTLLGIYFAVMLKQAFGSSTEGIYLRTRPDGKLFSLSRLRAKTKDREVLVRDMLFADNVAALVAHSVEQLQRLMDGLSRASSSFGHTISLKKTNTMAQGAEPAQRISISCDYWLQVVQEFTYLGSTVTDNLSMDPEIGKRIRAASTTFCVLSVLL